jgi:hypothetical protein
MKVTKLRKNSKLQSKMLDYILRVIDSKGKVVEAWRFQGYSGHSMWDEETYFKRRYPKDQGFSIEW